MRQRCDECDGHSPAVAVARRHSSGVLQPSKAPGTPPRDSAIHGTNRWPSSNAALQPAVEDYAERMSAVGAAIMRGIALGLGLHETTFQDRDGPADPYWCMRIIHYPPLLSAESAEPADGAVSSDRRSGDANDALSTAEKALSGTPLHLPRHTYTLTDCLLFGFRAYLS